MKGHVLLLVPLALTAFLASARAGVFFNRQPKPDPAVRVPELLALVKNDPDEHKRASAAEELRQYEGAAFPNMVPVLLDALQNDPKPSVRTEAAETLGKLRPVSQQVGRALEQALATDPSMRVRFQARYSLLTYHWGGYHSGKKGELPPAPTPEPPLAMPLPTPVAGNNARLVPVPAASAPQPAAAPARSVWQKASKSVTDLLNPKKASKSEEGPELIPPG